MAQIDGAPAAAGLPSAELREFLCLLRETCRRLMECGCSSNRVEVLAQKLGTSWGFEVEALAIPTGVWLTVRQGDVNLVELTRIRSWSVDLDRLARINDLVENLHGHRISIPEARQLIGAEVRAQPPYGMLATLFGGGVSSAILVYHYGGSRLEMALVLPVGLAVQALSKYALVGENRRFISDFVCGAVVALYAWAMHRVFPAIDLPRLIVGGIVALVPGLVLVNAVHEVAQKNLVSGAAKLLEAMVITASLGCGVAFALGIALASGTTP
jgi:uncharacterized membrane protein YjjP (DUF1212 family)